MPKRGQREIFEPNATCVSGNEDHFLPSVYLKKLDNKLIRSWYEIGHFVMRKCPFHRVIRIVWYKKPCLLHDSKYEWFNIRYRWMNECGAKWMECVWSRAYAYVQYPCAWCQCLWWVMTNLYTLKLVLFSICLGDCDFLDRFIDPTIRCARHPRETFLSISITRLYVTLVSYHQSRTASHCFFQPTWINKPM